MDFGLLSLGNHAINRIIPAIEKSGNRIVAIYSTSKEKGIKFSKSLGATYYDDLDRFYKSDCEAIYISSPNHLHYGHAKGAMLSGKAVLLEKPMTLDVKHSIELHELSQKLNIPLKIGFHLRFHSALKDVEEIIRDGKLGGVRGISGQWSHFSSHDLSNSWWGKDEMAGGGSIVGTGVHVMDTVFKLAGSDPESIFGFSLPHGSIIEDQFDILIKFNNQIIGHVISSRRIPACCNDLIVMGENGEVRVKNFFSTSVDSELTFNGVSKRLKGNDMYEMEIKDFVSKGSRIASSWDGVISTVLHLGAQKSAKDGKMVTLKELLGR